MPLYGWTLETLLSEISSHKKTNTVWFPLYQVSAATAAKSLQSCPTLCDPTDGRPPGSPVPEILQARTMGWIAISFSNAWKWKVKVKSLSRVWLFATPRTAAYQAPLPLGFSRQEYWSGVPFPSLRYKLLSIKLISNKDTLYSTGRFSQYFVIR